MSQLDEVVKYAKIVQFIKDYNIENATINDDLTVDVMGSVKLSNNDLTKIPVQFGKVTGDFFCSNNYLTTLKGLPRHVFGCVFCGDNKLTSG